MQFFYGNYFHAINQVHFTGINRSYRFSENQKTQFEQVDWGIKGRLLGGSQAEIYAALAILIDAYSVNNQSCGMLDDNGGLTPWYIDNAKTVGGTIVTSPVSHGEVSGSMGITYLDYTISISALFPRLDPLAVLSFSETVSFSDVYGLPLTVERVPAVGPPIIQAVTEQSWFFATQEGSLTWAAPFPPPRDPIWPYFRRQVDGAQSVRYMSPKMIRGVPIEYTVNWSYQFISDSPLYGRPAVIG